MEAQSNLKIAISVLLLVAYCISFSHVQKLRADLPPETKRAEALTLDPTLLKVVSGPFKGLAADYLNIKASVFMGGAWEVTDEDWEAVYTLLKQSLYLDPLFFQTGYYIQGLLSWRKGMHGKANDLLKYQAEQRYWDWEPAFYVGFNCFYFLHDYELAAKYLKMSSERPGAPQIASALAARMAQKAGHTLTAIALLKTMYENAQDERQKEYYGKRLEVQLGIHEIEQAIGRYQKSQGHSPLYLNDLVESGTMKKLPDNPFDTPYSYDPDSGKVTSDGR